MITIKVRPETRSFAVKAETRSFSVVEKRTFTVPAEDRILDARYIMGNATLDLTDLLIDSTTSIPLIADDGLYLEES